MAFITKEDALNIADKLNADIVPGTGHDIAKIYYERQLVAWFGIRRGSKKDLGHDYIPGQIHLSSGKTRLLAKCPLSDKQYFQVLKDKNVIKTPPTLPQADANPKSPEQG
jgi:hypothetical protein